MTTTYRLTATDSDLTGGADFNKAILDPASDATGTQTITLAASETRTSFGYTASGVPGADGVTGDYSQELFVNTGDTNVKLSVAWARVNSSGTQQAISAFTAEQDAAAGLQTHSATSVDLGTWASGDRLRVSLRQRNAHTHTGRNYEIAFGGTDSEVIAPWTISTSTTVSPAEATISLVGQLAVAVNDKSATDTAAATATEAPLGEKTIATIDAGITTASAGETDIDARVFPTEATITLAGQLPVVDTSEEADAIVTPATAALVLTGEAPTVASEAVLQPSTAALTLTGQAPAVASEARLEPATAALAIAGELPTVASLASLQPNTAALVLAGQTPVVDAGVTVEATVTPATAELTLAGQAAVVASEATTSPDAAAVALAGQQPALAVELIVELDIAAGEGAIVLAGQAPTVNTGTDIQATAEPATAALVVAGQAPAVHSLVDAAPAEAAIILAGQQTTVVSTARLSPDGATITVAGQTPAVASIAALAPSEAAITLEGQAPFVSTGSDIQVTAQPDAAALALVAAAPTVASEQVLTPGAGAVVLTGLAVTVEAAKQVKVLFPWTSDLDGFATGSGSAFVDGSWVSDDGDPDNGCLQLKLDSADNAGGAAFQRTMTFEDMGVPVGATITAIKDASARARCSEYTGAEPDNNYYYGAYINPGAWITLSDNQDGSPYSGTTAWATHTGPGATGLSYASNTSCVLDIGGNFWGATDPVAIAIRMDSLAFTIEYTESAAVSKTASDAATLTAAEAPLYEKTITTLDAAETTATELNISGIIRPQPATATITLEGLQPEVPRALGIVAPAYADIRMQQGDETRPTVNTGGANDKAASDTAGATGTEALLASKTISTVEDAEIGAASGPTLQEHLVFADAIATGTETGGNFNAVKPDWAEILLEGLQPAVSTVVPDQAAASPNTAQISLLGGVVSVISTITASPDTAGVDVIGQAPVVHTAFQPAAGLITFTGLQPGLSFGTAKAGTDTASITATDEKRFLGTGTELAVQVPGATIALEGLEPDVRLGIYVTPGAGVVSIQGLVATIHADIDWMEGQSASASWEDETGGLQIWTDEPSGSGEWTTS